MRSNILTTLRRVAVLGAMSLVAACSSDVTSPTAQSSRENSLQSATQAVDLVTSVDTLVNALETAVLGRTSLLSTDITVSTAIGQEGGRIAIPAAGFELIVPPGAVSKQTIFTVTALAGKSVAYQFGPHGIKFSKPLTLRQNSLNTVGWWNATGGGYFKDRNQVNTKTNKATINETLPLGWDGPWMTLKIYHFSGYLVSCA